ncbi:MAG TPA: helicase-exonuclease AddAB subunit AddA [Sedimentisphaerales bacterium]|nr:helicase-exonuclease AddAB subunit AddA [Sedimentisphaerales bacterium]
MSEKKIKWTEQQLRAITARGGDVLVTASAGTGKTAVLSGRCVDIVADRSACPDVWSILVLTFTEAAAEQMRSRIAQQLNDAYLERRDPHLRHQLLLLQGADISTIHSFCKRLITEHFYKLGLDPTFRVIDGDEQRLLKAEALEKTIEWAWTQSNLVSPLHELFYRRDLRTTDGFPAKIIAVSNFLDGLVSRDNWCRRADRLAQAANPFAGELGQRQMQIIERRLRSMLEQLRCAKTLYESRGQGDWSGRCEETYIRPLAQLMDLLTAGDWDEFTEGIRGFQKPTVRKPPGVAEPLDELIKSMVKKAVDGIDELLELAVLNPEYLDKVSGAVGRQTTVLVELVKRFDRLYSQAKRAINCLDFADLEHHALSLLSAEDSSQEQLSPSAAALALRSRYRYIFVDEYQDINGVQQTILDLLSSGGNVFVVGDVKQSIYAWRGAEPDIFIEHLKQASNDRADAPAGLRVDLNTNFRSAKGVLDFVNKIFGRIMSARFAKIDYDESARLRPAPENKPKPSTSDAAHAVEFHILCRDVTDPDSAIDRTTAPGDTDNQTIVSSRQLQAAMIARRIRQMVGADAGKAEFEIYDKRQDRSRDVEYRDIVVLMRSLAKKADFVEVLRLAGIPVNCDAIAGYFEATEISDLLSLLKVLDNPQRDIELAAVLRSPLFGVTDTQLAKLTMHAKSGRQQRSFHDSVISYCDSGPDPALVGKLRKVLAQIEQWRTLARRGSLADLIWQIYRETGYLSFVTALPNGQARRANLLKLHDRAIQFEGFASSRGVASLTRFVEFIEKLQQVGQDWAPAEPDSSAENSVRVISVHKSKGLEFPVVFLAELDGRFNKSDLYDDCLADSRYTLGLQIIDRPSNSRLRSLAHQVIAEEKLAASLAEEMRILYVAATRARERLILTASQSSNHCRDILCKGFFFGDAPIGDWALLDCQNPLEWLLYGLCDQKNLHEAFQTELAGETRDDKLFDLTLHDRDELENLSESILELKADKYRRVGRTVKKPGRKPKDARLLEQVKSSLSWSYGFGDAPVLPAKLSVTQLTHRNDEYVRPDYSGALDRRPSALPAGEGDIIESVEARTVGTATHLLIAELDLTGPIDKEAVERVRERMTADGSITPPVAERIDVESIIQFFTSDLGRQAIDARNTLWREWPFTFTVPASNWCATEDSTGAGCGDEPIIVQGIIDMLIRTPRGLLVIDFKTDNVSPEEATRRATLYRQQLALYSSAAAEILKSHVAATWLYFLTPRCAVRL